MNSRYRLAAFDSLSKHIAIIDQAGVIQDVNEAWRRFSHDNGPAESTSTCIGANYLEVCERAIGHRDGDEAEAVATGIRAVLEGRQHEFRAEYPCHSPDQERWFLLGVTRIDEQPPAAVVTHLNITARKQAELARARSGAMLQGLFDLAPVGICLTDLDTGRVVDLNQALCHIVGYSREELLGAPDGKRNGHAPGQVWQQCLEEARSAGRFGPLEAGFVHKYGHTVHVQLSGTRIIGPDGRPCLWSIEQDISETKAMEVRLRAAAERDVLTRLPNRAVLLQHLEQLIQAGRATGKPAFTVMFLDLDRFKLVNDTLGHGAGDELLLQMAGRLRAELPEPEAGTAGTGHFVARFGGDEFVCVSTCVQTVEAARAWAETMQRALAAPYSVAGERFESTVSIGLVLANATSGSAHELLRDADTAMYEAKRAGGAACVVYDDAMHERLSRSLLLEAGLRQALQRTELRLLYQPIVDLATGKLASVETLLRWEHPSLGDVSPNEFIPVAEETGLIVSIGEWVLRESCRQWQRWQRDDPANAPSVVSVNLSRRQLALGPRLLETVQAALVESGMPAHALQLEITEREVMRHPESARSAMQALSELGVRLAMDDFGTGTSSLGCLRDYPFQTIKIDKSFVTDLGRDSHVLALAHATVNVIENLGMVSVAEGVERPEEVAMLQAMGCRYAQGYLFGRPMNPRALLALAARAPQAPEGRVARRPEGAAGRNRRSTVR